jgi:hypothetical protein
MCVAKLLETGGVIRKWRDPDYRPCCARTTSGQYGFLKTAKALIDLTVPLPLFGPADAAIE